MKNPLTLTEYEGAPVKGFRSPPQSLKENIQVKKFLELWVAGHWGVTEVSGHIHYRLLVFQLLIFTSPHQ